MPPKRKATSAKPARYVDRKALNDAVRTWCLGQLDTHEPWLRLVASNLPHIHHTRTAQEDAARDVYLRLRDLLRDAEETQRASTARLGYYSSQLQRAAHAVKIACGRHSAQEAINITVREQIVEHVEMVRRPPWKPAATIREITILSLLAGNGRDWVTKRIKLAKETAIASHRPTVLDVVRAEERAIRQTRQRAK